MLGANTRCKMSSQQEETDRMNRDRDRINKDNNRNHFHLFSLFMNPCMVASNWPREHEKSSCMDWTRGLCLVAPVYPIQRWGGAAACPLGPGTVGAARCTSLHVITPYFVLLQNALSLIGQK